MGYLANGPVHDGLIEIEHLTLVVLYEESLTPQYSALRLAGFAAKRIPWGIRLGGPGQCLFCKDLRLQPVPGANGYRLDLDNTELLSLGLALNQERNRHMRSEKRRFQEHPRLPKLWAAFRPADATQITGDGPELTAYATKTGLAPEVLLERLRREHGGLVLHPLAWVSHHWQQALAVFADLERYPQRQVFYLRRDGLTGFHDAVEFDFRSNAGTGNRRRSGRRRKLALAAA